MEGLQEGLPLSDPQALHSDRSAHKHIQYKYVSSQVMQSNKIITALRPTWQTVALNSPKMTSDN